MATKYFNPDAPGIACTGMLMLNSVPPDGAICTIPGDSPSVFTFDVADPGGVTWVDTSSGDLPTILANWLAVLAITNYASAISGSQINLTWRTPGTGPQINVIATSDPSISVSGFSGGQNPGSADGDYSVGGTPPATTNFYLSDDGTSPVSGPTSTDTVVLQLDATQGSGVAGNLSSNMPAAVNGASITIFVASTAQVKSGTILAPTVPDDQYVLAGHGSPGTLTLSDAGHTLTSNGAYGVGGNGSTPTATYPAGAYVDSSLPAYGINGNSITPTLTRPAVNQVLTTGGSWGIGGNGSTGTATIPGVTFVASPATGGPATYGVGGTGSIGTLTLTAAANVIHGSGVFGVGGTSITPNYFAPATNAVDSTTTFGVGNATTGGNISNVLATNVVKIGTAYGIGGAKTGIYTGGGGGGGSTNQIMGIGI